MRALALALLLAGCPGEPPVEQCNGVDDDGDGEIDEGLAVRGYTDVDGDGAGVGEERLGCPSDELAASAGDCDDDDPDVHPAADERCDAVDRDCDGDAVAGAVDAQSWFLDGDADGYGVGEPSIGCAPPDARPWAAAADDCDDLDPDVFPGAPERCNGLSDDCDAEVDEDLPAVFADADGDGFGDPAAPLDGCETGLGRVADDSDCEDEDPELHPDTVWYYDADRDGYGVDSPTEVQCEDPGTLWARRTGDCRPADADAYPGAPETCDNGFQSDGIDDDCNGHVDDGCRALRCGAVEQDEVWPGETLLTCDVRVAGDAAPTLTLPDGAVLRFVDGAGLTIGGADPGALVVEGDVDGVWMGPDAEADAPGAWDGLRLDVGSGASVVVGLTVDRAAVELRDGAPTLDGLVVEDAPVDGLIVSRAAPVITGATVRGAAGYGLSCAATPCLGSLTGSTLTGNAAPARLPVDGVGGLGAGNDLTGNDRDQVDLTGFTMSASAAWVDPGVPFHLPLGLVVAGQAAPAIWTVGPGVVIAVGEGQGIRVGAAGEGELHAIGARGAPVRFTSAGAAAPGAWEGLSFQSGSAASTLERVIVEYAGGSAVLDASVYLNGGGRLDLRDAIVRDGARDGIGVWSGLLAAARCEVSGHGGAGLAVDAFGDLESFDLCTSTNNAAPARFENADAVGSLGDTSTYTGNEVDAILIDDLGMERTSTWVDLGLPYRFSNSFMAAADGGMSWTVEDAVIEIADGRALSAGMTASRAGVLVLDGAVLTTVGDDPVRTWAGLDLRTPGSVVSGTVIRRAASDAAAIELYGGGMSFTGNTVESAAIGVRCWQPGSVLSGNAFVSVTTNTSGC